GGVTARRLGVVLGEGDERPGPHDGDERRHQHDEHGTGDAAGGRSSHGAGTATDPAHLVPSGLWSHGGTVRPTKVRFAVAVAPSTPEPIGYVRLAEQLGFDSIWLSDLPMMAASDPVVALAALAGATERVHLGVNLVPF